MAAWGGISSLQFGLSLFWTQAVRTPRRQLTVGKMNQLLCRALARLGSLDNVRGDGREGRRLQSGQQEAHSETAHQLDQSPYLGFSHFAQPCSVLR